MKIYQVKIHLLSDTTFGRGDGVAGLIDQEVEHDSYGFPYLRGRTLKGLLREECDNIIHVLPQSMKQYWQKIANQIFGSFGSSLDTLGCVHFGDASLPPDLRQVFAKAIDDNKKNENAIDKKDVLDSLTTIRRSTSINTLIGVADDRSLRSFRVIIRDLIFTSNLHFEDNSTDEQQDILALLAVSTLALRRLGSGRNRGRGYVNCSLLDSKDQDITESSFQYFISKEVN